MMKSQVDRESEITPEETRDKRLLRALDVEGTGKIRHRVLPEALARFGLRADDVRLAESLERLSKFDEDGLLTYEQRREVIRPNMSIVERALRGDLIIPDFPALCEDVREMYEQTKKNEGGKVADYIPQLARVPAKYFGVSLCTVDGQRFSIGDSKVDFSVQSCTKPINYCIALEENGIDDFHRYVGREPSGRGFNELTLNKDHKPHNPMINSGAIATCALIRRGHPIADRFDFVMDQWSRFAGNQKRLAIS